MIAFGLASGIVGGAATVLLIYGFFVDRSQAIYSYLFAFATVLTVAIGALFLLMIGHASNARWFVPLRRQCERIVTTLPLLGLGIVPILFFLGDLYPWMHVHDLPHLIQHHVEKKLAWLDASFFIWRSIVYVVLFVLVGELLAFWSRKQDAARDQAVAARLRQRMVNLSVGGLVLLSFVLSLAGWDWIMSLEPAWYSNLYGVYLFAGGLVSALGVMGILSVGGRERGFLPEQISSSHYHALGRLQLALVIFWAYIGWCHVLQQWIANIPVEQLWYLKRWYNGWQWEGMVLALCHFVLPFFLLLSRYIKKNPRTFVVASSWLVLVHPIDIHYLVLPALHHSDYVLHWLDFVALVAVAGLTICFATLRGRHLQAIPVRDPLLGRGLAYESQS